MKIIIAGEMREGKTTLVKFIVDALIKEGFDISEIIDPDYERIEEPDLQEKRLEKLKSNDMTLIVETIQTISQHKPTSRSRETRISNFPYFK